MSEVEKSKKTLKVTYGEINDKNINLIRKLNYETFPVKYSTSFYINLIEKYTALSRMVYYHDIIIGAYTVRVEPYK